MLSSITMPAAATILIVDDYPDALDVWDLYLRASGFDVLRAEDGPSALRCATEQLPDLVVMDLELPGLSGSEVAKALRDGAATRHIPLIASTGHSLPAKLDEARRAGFDLILIKPCDPAELVEEIRRYLPKRGSGSAAAADR
jgi:two-component system cell cycle response regulator DivK